VRVELGAKLLEANRSERETKSFNLFICGGRKGRSGGASIACKEILPGGIPKKKVVVRKGLLTRHEGNTKTA